jgi:hypothetical protein
MSLAQADVVDFVGVEKGGGRTILTIVDDSDWQDEQEHLFNLQEKLNRYLAFIESGEVFEHPNAGRARPIVVRVLAKYELPSKAHEFLGYAESTFSSAGFALEWKHLRIPE